MTSGRSFLRGIAVVVTLAIAGAAGASRVTLSLSPAATGTVTFKRAAGAEPFSLAVAFTAEPAHVELPPGSYLVEVAARGWWMAPRLVTVRDDDDRIALTLRRTGTVEGVSSEPLPEVVLRFEDASTAGEVRCPMTARVFRCEVPEGTFDLRIGANGYVPQYRWSVPVAQTVKLGSIALVRGASLSGRVEVEDGDTRGVRLSLGSIAITPAGNGFFLAGPLPPGEYTLNATRKGLVGPPRAVTVLEGHEARLREPIVLSKPRSLAVSISPPADPLGNAWRVRLVRKDGSDLGESAASADGSWRRDDLARADYELRVRPSGGRAWHVEEVAVDEAETWKPVAIQAVPFRGTVRLGDTPVAAKVIFGGEHSPNPLPFNANHDGEFHGFLPTPPDGRWRVTVKHEQPKIASTLTDIEVKTNPATGIASIDIRLPATGIEGEVLGAEGKPAANAIVNISPAAADLALSQIESDADGCFAVHGLPAGTYRVSATAYLADAPATTVELTDEPVFVRLQLGTTRKWTGTITTPDGRPVAGARILALPLDVDAEFGWNDQSNHEGRFTLLIPSAARLADIRIAAHGFPFSISRRVVTSEPLHLVVDPRGATLIVDYDTAPGHEPFLWHNGAVAPVEGLLHEWRGELETLSPHRRRLRIPQLEPGHYTLCLLRSGSFDHAASKPGPACPSIYLPPFGTEVARLTAR